MFPTVSACETMCLVFKMWGVYTFVYEIRTTGTAHVNRIKDKHSLALLARCSVATVTSDDGCCRIKGRTAASSAASDHWLVVGFLCLALTPIFG